MRRYLALITNLALIFVFVCSSLAKPVGMDNAIKVGRTYLRVQEQSWKGEASSAPGKFSGSILDIRRLNANGKTLAYILDLGPEGCVVVSPDTDISPVIAYSSEGRFSMEDTQDNVLLHLVRRDMENRLEALAITPKEMKDSSNILWSKYLAREEEFIQQLSSAETWGPWLKTYWGQDTPYNKYCPRICPENCPVGCAATAMAQIIYYWEYPYSVTFNNEDRYVTKKEKKRIDEDSVLSFDQLNFILSDIKYDGNEDEIAALCLACGISVEMDYTCDGSGAIPNAEVYKSKFKYASADQIYEFYDAVGFYNILEENMKNGQPAQLGVYSKKDDGTDVGHSLVADGFRYPGEYHLNFGGGSIDNCWYSAPFPPIHDVPPLSNEMKEQLNIFDYGVVNIRPQYDNPVEVYFRGNSYKLVNQSMSWRNARSYAESLGGHLVNISDEAENRFVTDLAMKSGVLRFWIGLTDEAEEGHFVWVTGEPLTYTKWLTGEPNDYGGAEDYAEIGFGIPYFWNDNNSSWSQPFVVEFEGVASTFRGNSYTVINQSMSWGDARLYAESLGGHLVTISDDEENRFVADLARVKGIRRSFWIGLTDEAEEGHFAWVTSEPLTYENWYPEEPNNYGGDEDYAEMGFHTPYSWNDNGDDQVNPFVVEIGETLIPAGPVLTVQAASDSFNIGDSFQIRIDMANGHNIAGFQFDVAFNATILQAVQVDEGAYLSDSNTYWLEPTIDNTAGTITEIVCARTSKGWVAGNGTLAIITFKAVAAGTSYIRLQNITVSAPNGASIPVSASDGNVAVNEFRPWDVNEDGKVSVADLVLIGQHYGETITVPTSPNPDVNGDRVVDIADLVLVGLHFSETYLPGAPASDMWSFDIEYLPVLVKMYNIMVANLSSDTDFLATKELLRRIIFNSGIGKAVLFQNYPNPFNPETWIPYQLAEDSPVTIRIYSSTGQLIKTMDLGYKKAGAYVTKDAAAYWDGRSKAGEYVASGVYFYSIQAGDFVATNKMTVFE